MRIFRTTSTWLFAFLGALALTGCDSNSPSQLSSSSSQSSVTYSSVQASDFGNLQVHFPPPGSQVDSETVTVRGTILDAAEIETLTVDGQTVDAADFADWQVAVALESGENAIVVEAIDTSGNATTKELTVRRAQSPIRVIDLTRDPATGTLYLLDDIQHSIFSVDAQTGEASALALSGDNALTATRHMVFDWANDQLVVAQRADARFVTVDVQTGEQTVREITFDEERDLAEVPYDMVFDGTALYLVYNETIKFDEEGNRVPADTEEPASRISYPVYYRVDPQTWQASVVTEYDPDGEYVLYPVTAMASDPDEPYLYVGELRPSSGIPRLARIDKASGEVTRIDLQDADGEAVSLVPARDLLLDSASQTLYQLANDAVLSVELDGGLYQTVSNNVTPEEQAIRILEARRFTSGDAGTAVYFDDATDQLVSVDLEDGTRGLFGSGQAAAPYISVRDLTLDVRNQLVYALDANRGAIFKQDLETGGKSTVLTFNDYESPTPIANPDTYDVRADRNNPISSPVMGAVSATGMLMLIDSYDPKVTAITSGEDGYTADIQYRLGNTAFVDLAVDDITGTFYLVQERNIASYLTGTAEPSPIQAFSGGTIPTDANRFRNVRSAAVDKTNNRLLATDSTRDAIIAVDLESGERTIFSALHASQGEDDPVINLPGLIAVHDASQQALVVDTSAQGVFTVDLQDGSNKQLWLDLKQSATQGLTNPTAMTVHPFFHYALFFDELSHRIVAVDMMTKEIVTIGR